MLTVLQEQNFSFFFLNGSSAALKLAAPDPQHCFQGTQIDCAESVLPVLKPLQSSKVLSSATLTN